MSDADHGGAPGDLAGATATDAIIEQFGGIRPMAAKLGIPATTVQGWKKRGSIPETRTDDIVAAAQSHNIALRAADIAAATAPEALGTRMNLEDLEREIAAAPAAKPASPPPPQNPVKPLTPPLPARRGGGLLGGTALLVALAALGLSGYGTWRDLTAPPALAPTAPPDLSPLSDRVAALETRQQELAAALDALRQADSTQPTIVGRTPVPAEPALSPGIPAIDTSALEQRLTALEDRPATESTDLAPLTNRVEALEAVTTELVPRLTMLETRRQMGAAGEGLIVAVGQLQAALAGGRPYARELRAARALVAADTALADLLAPLEATAEAGLAGDIALRDKFRLLAPVVLRADRERPDATWTDQVLARMANVITLRRASGEVAGDDAASILARAEAGLLSGDLPRAVNEMESLPAHAAGPAKEWLELANARMAAEATAATLADMALARMAGSGDGREGK